MTKWCEEKVAGRGNSSRWVSRECLSGCSPGLFREFLPARSAAVLGSWCGKPWTSHFRIGIPIRTPLLSGEPEDRSWWMPVRSRIRFFGTRSAAGLEIPECRGGLGSSSSSFTAGRVRGWATSSASDRWFKLRYGEKPMRASAAADPGLPLVRIFAESKTLELRGIVTSWSSEQEHAMSGTA